MSYLDGNTEVKCSRCKSYIAHVPETANFRTAICAVCTAEDEGLILTQEQKNSLRSAQYGDHSVSENTVAFYEVEDPLGAKVLGPDASDEEIKNNRISYYGKALVSRVSAAVKALVAKPESQILAKEKRARRVFDKPIDQKIEDKS